MISSSVLIVASATAFFLNFILTPVILLLSHKFLWYDHMDDRKIHTSATPRIGGVGFFLSFTVSALLTSLIGPLFLPNQSFPPLMSPNYVLMLVGFSVVHIIGLYDDFRNLRAIYKLIGQIIAGAMVVLGGALVDEIYLPILGTTLPLGPLSGAVTIIWLISISNAVNLIDGMDGLAGGTAAIASAALCAVHLLFHNASGAFFSALIFGALVAFLFFNRPKARIFMGDSGSLFLGFFLGALAFIGAGENGVDREEFMAGFILTTTLLLIPILDTVSAILRRIREGRAIHHPDQEHIHHKMLALGLGPWKILGIIHGINLLLAAAVVYWAITRGQIGRELWGDLALVASWVLAGSFFFVLHLLNQRRKRAVQPD